MAGILQLPVQVPGMVGVFPQQKFMLTTDAIGVVTAAGYLNNASMEANPLSSTDIVQCIYAFNQQTGVGIYGVFTVTITNGVITLVQWANPGEVVTPTVANSIAYFVDTLGTISSAAGNVINSGNIQAGLSGTAGLLASFPATAAKGSLRLAAVANTGDTLTTISNVAMGQASVISIPDPANAVGRLLVGATATPFTSGNIPAASGTGGLMVDSGKAAAALATFTSPTVANRIAVFSNTTGNLDENVATAINGGNLQAGLSGTAGTLASFPGTAANGSLIVAAVNAGGAFNTTISNGTMAQSTVYTIPDVTAVTGQFLVKTAALVNGNLIQASGTAGVTVDSGVATTALQLKAQVKAGITANIGGAGAGPISVVVAGFTASSVVVANIASSSNAVAVAKCIGTATGFDVTFTADPGAACVVNYIGYLVAQ